MSRLLFCLAVAACFPLARPAVAQGPSAHLTPFGPETPRWVGHFTVLAGNATLGAITGGVLQKLRGGSFKDGFVRGALGGAVIYAGKRTAVLDFWGAGFLGREIHAVGVSVVRNASDGEGTFSRLFLPLGPLPVRATVGLTNGFRLRPQLDLSAAAWLTYGLVESRLQLDLGQSFSFGATVFEASGRRILDNGVSLGGFTAGRSMFLSDPRAFQTVAAPEVVSHERVHVLQEDFVLTAWSEPLTRVLLRPVPGGPFVTRHAAVDVLDWVVGALNRIIYDPNDFSRFPTELEAEFLSGR